MKRKSVEIVTETWKVTSGDQKTIMGVKVGDITLVEVPVNDLWVDPDANCLEKKWWHKLVFWKRYKYPRYVVRGNKTNPNNSN